MVQRAQLAATRVWAKENPGVPMAPGMQTVHLDVLAHDVLIARAMDEIGL